MIALIRIIILFFDDIISKIKFKFWFNEFNVRIRFHNIIVVNNMKNDNSIMTRKIKCLNLNLKNCIRQNNIAFFSINMIFWKNLLFSNHIFKSDCISLKIIWKIQSFWQTFNVKIVYLHIFVKWFAQSIFWMRIKFLKYVIKIILSSSFSALLSN